MTVIELCGYASTGRAYEAQRIIGKLEHRQRNIVKNKIRKRKKTSITQRTRREKRRGTEQEKRHEYTTTNLDREHTSLITLRAGYCEHAMCVRVMYVPSALHLSLAIPFPSTPYGVEGWGEGGVLINT